VSRTASPIRLFVGYDRDQALASQVFVHSALRRSSVPLQVTYLVLPQLQAIFDRPREPLQSTEFAFTRWLVPYLCGYAGRALFVDGDMICRSDLAALWALFDERCVVQVVQRAWHEMTPEGRKFLGRAQTAYARKNWSSVMLFNNAKCRRLEPQYVATAPGLDLHQFRWLAHDYELGALPASWNHLVGVDKPNLDADLVHFTLGMPYFHGWNECEYAPEWRRERDAMQVYLGGPVEEAVAV
jgi:hypothetical protein